MKYLPPITLVVWISIVIGYIFAKNMLLQPMIKFPVFILLSVFFPVCFWTLQASGRKIYSSLFVLIFLLNTGLLIYGLQNNYSALKVVEQKIAKEIDPSLAELLVSGESEKERRVASRIIFQKHGVALPYRSGVDEFILFSPTQMDKDIFLDNHEKNYVTTLAQQNLSDQIISFIFLLVLQGTIFLAIVIFLVLYESPQKNNRSPKSKIPL